MVAHFWSAVRPMRPCSGAAQAFGAEASPWCPPVDPLPPASPDAISEPPRLTRLAAVPYPTPSPNSTIQSKHPLWDAKEDVGRMSEGFNGEKRNSGKQTQGLELVELSRSKRQRHVKARFLFSLDLRSTQIVSQEEIGQRRVPESITDTSAHSPRRDSRAPSSESLFLQNREVAHLPCALRSSWCRREFSK